MRKVAVLVSLVGVGIGGVVFACGSSDPVLPDLPLNDAATYDVAPSEAGPGDAAMMSSAADFCQGTLGTYSALIAKCCVATDLATPQGTAISSHAQNILAACVTAIQSSVAKGRTMYQQAQAEACKAAYTTQFTQNVGLCGTLQEIDPTVEADPMCALAFIGLGDNNALCSSDLECKDGLTCVGYGGGNDGTCRMPASAAGGACGSLRNDGSLGALVIPMGTHPACGAGFYCDSATTTCIAQIGPGTACTRNDQCTSPGRCDGTGHCTNAALVAQNSVCTTTVDCIHGSWCDHTNADGGPMLTATGLCASKKSTSDICDPTEVGECAGVCPSGATQCVGFCGSQ